jgi:hypothetical protein
MSSSVTDLLSGYFSEELAGARPMLRSSLINGGPEGVDRLRVEFREFLSKRPMTRDEFWTATSAWFDSEEALYAAVEDAHRFFFDEEPPSAETSADS